MKEFYMTIDEAQEIIDDSDMRYTEEFEYAEYILDVAKYERINAAAEAARGDS